MLRLLPPRLRAVVRMGRMWWRRSLLLRVVAATLALGIVVLLVVGQILLSRITDGLIESARAKAQSDAQQQITGIAIPASEKSPVNWANQKLSDLSGPLNGRLRYVALRKALGSRPGPIPDLQQGLAASSIPENLRRQVVDEPDNLATQVLTLPIYDPDQTDQPGVAQQVMVVGKLIKLAPQGANADGDARYEIYLAYKLDREIGILGNIQRTFLAGGLALLVLIGLVAWVVTRQVVAPVRQAARTAEQLASGRLDRRMPVRGEDDLARLGRAFNEMAASLERQIHQLEELSRVQRRFVSDVSHELRTPLTTIRMAGEVMYEARGAFEPSVSRSAELLQTQLDRFESLLSDLLEVSRFDAGAALLEVEAFDVCEVVSRVVEGLRPLAERKGVPVVLDVPTVPALAEIDARRVERIVRNLVANAIEHGEGRSVDVRVRTDADAVAVGVRDHGIGLTPAELRMVFNRFWRADPARARTTGGTGLGLAIALEDAHLHGGWLQAWGSRGHGAHFRLTLPRRAGVVLSGSPLPLVPEDAPSDARALAVRDTPLPPVALVVAADGTSVVASDGAAAVLADESSGAVSLPPARAGVSGGDAGGPVQP